MEVVMELETKTPAPLSQNSLKELFMSITHTHTHTAGVTVDDGVEGDGGVKSDSGGEEDEVDMRAYRPAGGPILLQLLEMPPPPKMTNNWTIRRGMVIPLSPTLCPSVCPSVCLSTCVSCPLFSLSFYLSVCLSV